MSGPGVGVAGTAERAVREDPARPLPNVPGYLWQVDLARDTGGFRAQVRQRFDPSRPQPEGAGKPWEVLVVGDAFPDGGVLIEASNLEAAIEVVLTFAQTRRRMDDARAEYDKMIEHFQRNDPRNQDEPVDPQSTEAVRDYIGTRIAPGR